MEVKLEVKEIGKNEFEDMRNVLNRFVKDNFSLLYEGAIRLGVAIGEDYYAPRRVQINRTRLHESKALKYACGHKYDEDYSPTEEQLKETVRDLQTLLDAAGRDILCPFTIEIRDNR